MIHLLTELLDKNLRNSLVKHNYIIDLKKNEIRYFSPDALVGTYKEKGKITNQELLKKVITLKVVFWVLLYEIYLKNEQVEELEQIIGEYSGLNKIVESFLSLNGINVLKAIVSNYKTLRNGIFDFCEVNNQEILQHQLKESWLSLKLFVLKYFDPNKIPDRATLGHFSWQDQLILMNKNTKSFYILLYEEMMQTIVHPMGLLLKNRLSKVEALDKLRMVENQKFKHLFNDLHPDLRDSPAHNSYYYHLDNNKWFYYKLGELLPTDNVMDPFGIFYNYQNLINVIFPDLMKISDELVIAQILMAITKSDNISDPNFWEKREKRMLKLSLIYWAAVCCVKKALCYCQKDKPAKASRVLSELDHGVYQSLTNEEFESLIGWGMIHDSNPKTRLLPKSLAKRLRKRMRKGSIDHIITRRSIFVQLFASMQTRSLEEIKKFEKMLRDFSYQ